MAQRIVIAGSGQYTQARDAEPPFLDPIDMMERAAREAGLLAGSNVVTGRHTIGCANPKSKSSGARRGDGATPRH